MSTSSAQTMSGSKPAGLALMAGVVLLFISSLLHPGGAFIDPVDQTDLPRAIIVMADYASLTHVLTMLIIFGMLLYCYSFLALFRVSRQEGLADSALRFGIITSMFGWGIFILAMGMRHFTIHLMQRSMDSAMAPEMQAEFEILALNVYTGMAGVVLALVAIYPISSILVGLGLASRFRGMNIFKLASYGLVAIGAASLVNFLIVQHIPDAGPATLLLINNLLLFVGSFCLFAIGLGMYQGRSELAPAGSSE